jgi:hypothetical protein
MRRREFIAGMAALLPARALGANVLSACGSANFTPGTPGKWTVDTNGIVCSSGGVAAPVTSKWSGADAVANGMTLSPDGLTVTTAGTGYQSIRGTNSQTTGKFYVEFKSGVTTNGLDDPAFGLANAGFVATDYLGHSPSSMGFFTGSTHSNFGNPSAGFTSNYTTGLFPQNNDVWALAIDLATGKIWLAQNNVWLNSSNPATASLPMATFSGALLGQTYFPAMTIRNASTTPIWTLQSTAAKLKYAPPSGFTPWG